MNLGTVKWAQRDKTQSASLSTCRWINCHTSTNQNLYAVTTLTENNTLTIIRTITTNQTLDENDSKVKKQRNRAFLTTRHKRRQFMNFRRRFNDIIWRNSIRNFKMKKTCWTRMSHTEKMYIIRCIYILEYHMQSDATIASWQQYNTSHSTIFWNQLLLVNQLLAI